MRLTHGRLPEQRVISRRKASGCNLSALSPPQWFTPDGFRSLFALVGTNGQGIGTRLGDNVPDILDLSLRALVGD